MPAPTIDPETSVLAYPQWVRWEHTFAASQSPTSWQIASGGFPTGMEFQPELAVVGEADDDTLTLADHGLSNGNLVVFPLLTGGAGLATGTLYFVRDRTDDTFKLAASAGGAALNFTTDISAGTLQRIGYLVGAATIPGISTVRLTATNGTGASAEVLFTIGIEPAASAPDSNADLVWDLVTGLLTRQTLSTLPAPAAASDEPVLTVKEGDNLMVRLRLVKGGTVIDLPAVDLQLVLKEFEPDNEIVASDAWVKVGEGTGASYLLHAQFTGAALAGSLSNYEKDAGTAYDGLAEFEITFTNPESIGPESLILSTRTFRLRVERDLAENL